MEGQGGGYGLSRGEKVGAPPAPTCVARPFDAPDEVRSPRAEDYHATVTAFEVFIVDPAGLHILEAESR